jgi:hypothetical protein
MNVYEVLYCTSKYSAPSWTVVQIITGKIGLPSSFTTYKVPGFDSPNYFVQQMPPPDSRVQTPQTPAHILFDCSWFSDLRREKILRRRWG